MSMSLQSSISAVMALALTTLSSASPPAARAMGGGHAAADRTEARPEALLRSLPLAFVVNRGQWDAPARFVAQRGDLAVRVEEAAIVLQLRGRDEAGETRALAVRLAFEGARTGAAICGSEPQAARRSYFLGNDPERWRSGVPAYSKVVYRGLYEGIDLVLREEAGTLEYDLLLAPEAELGRVVVACEGIAGLEIDADGSLLLESALGTLVQRPPTTWGEELSGERRPIECAFVKLGEERFGFRLHERPAGLPVVIDPGLEWSTFLGGSEGDQLWDLTADASGRVLVGGRTFSMDFPTTRGAFDPSFNSNEDGVVACLDPAQMGANQLVWATYLGGSVFDRVSGVELDEAGNLLLVGHSSSPDFPTTAGAYDRTPNGGWDAFVARLSADGTTLQYASLLGGSDDDFGLRLSYEGAGTVVIGGTTASVDFPATGNAAQPSSGGGLDQFVGRLALAGGGAADLLYSTYLGGSADEGFGDLGTPDMRAFDLALAPPGEIYVTGVTHSADFPITPAVAYDPSLDGPSDLYLTRIDPSVPGNAGIAYSTFVGGSHHEGAVALSVDPVSGAVTIGGYSYSPDFPTTGGAFDSGFVGTFPDRNDAVLLRLDPGRAPADQLLYSTYVGGEGFESFYDLAVDAAGVVYGVGFTGADGLAFNSFPVTCGAFDESFNGERDHFVLYLDPRGNGRSDLLYSTFLGGTLSEGLFGLERLPNAPAPSVYAAGATQSYDYPTTPGAYQPNFGGGLNDGVVVRLELNPRTYCIAAANSTGPDGALICGSGSVSVADNDFTLSVAGAAISQPGLFYYGPQAVEFPFGDGYRCVGGGAFRLNPPVTTDGTGSASRALDLTDPPAPDGQITPGSTWHFQYWYRDPAAAGSGFNLSNGLRATFHP